VPRRAGDGECRSEHERQPVLHLPPGPDGKLPKNYTLFGQVTKGMDVVDQIVSRPRTRDLPTSRSRSPVTITRTDPSAQVRALVTDRTRAQRR
jgi:cyclophilin family peptidyl-prolyl cis-trans isomerase